MKSRLGKYADTLFAYIPTGKPADFWVITAYNPNGITGFAIIAPGRVIRLPPSPAKS